MIIYFDMDGTIADYESKFIELYGSVAFKRCQEDKNFKKEMRQRQVDDRFFQLLKPLQYGFDLMHSCFDEGHDVGILTATGSHFENDIANQKFKWIVNNCDSKLVRHIVSTNNFIALTRTHNKGLLASDGIVLVDDREKALNAWSKAGGIAIDINDMKATQELVKYGRKGIPGSQEST